MATALEKAKDFLLDVFFPKFCLLCFEGNEWVCARCNQKLAVQPATKCALCLVSDTTPACSACRENYAFSSLSYAFPYENEDIQTLIHAFKYQGVTEIADILSGKLEEIVRFYPFRSSWVVVPVPLHWQRKNERGYNQAELLAEGLARRLDVQISKNSLIRTRYTKSQVNFSREERQKNIHNVFAVKDQAEILGKNILLVDDVATTLTTLNSCAETLRQSGAKNIWCVVVARAKI